MRKNNKKAPRMKLAKYTTRVFTKALYNTFITSFPQYKDMTWKEFQAIWTDLTETIRYEAGFNPLGVKLPSYNGDLKLQFLPYKFKAKDYGNSRKEGMDLNHVNISTKGKVARLIWERRSAVKFNKMLQFFAFFPCEALRNSGGKHVAQNPEQLRVARNTLGGKRTWR